MENAQSQNMNVPNQMNDKTMKGIKVLILVLAIIFIAYLLMLFTSHNKAAVTIPAPVITAGLPFNYTYKVIPQNNYPTGFPESVIVKSANGVAGVWQRAEDTTTGNSEKLKVVEFTYKNTIPSVLAPLYEQTFKTAGWTMTPGAQITTSPIVLDFNKGAESATLTIISINSTDSLANITIKTN